MIRMFVAHHARMLHDFLTTNHNELIDRCRAKVATRFEASMAPSPVEHGVPMLLLQIAETLRREQLTPRREVAGTEPAPAPTEIGRAAALHGTKLQRLGCSIDQVVHDYGDLCQAVTELAVERKEPISIDEFHTFNRCLDNAIADAVAAFGVARENRIEAQAQTMHTRLKGYSDEHRRLSDVAIEAFTAIRSGNAGVSGATGNLLMHTLSEMQSLADRSLPQVHLISQATAVTSR